MARGDSLRKWHQQMKEAGLRRNGSVYLEDGVVCETGWREPDMAVAERAADLYLHSEYSISEILEELGIGHWLFNRMLKMQGVKKFRPFRNPRLGRRREGNNCSIGLIEWHRKMKKLKLPRNGSVTVVDGEVVKTGRVVHSEYRLHCRGDV